MGDTWYDSLQVTLTKRYSHGLTLAGAYTWQKELTNGANSNTAYLTPNPPLINDVYNRDLNKQISGFSQPQTLVVSFSYTTPTINTFLAARALAGRRCDGWRATGASPAC